jgi:hypothetical protein
VVSGGVIVRGAGRRGLDPALLAACHGGVKHTAHQPGRRRIHACLLFVPVWAAGACVAQDSGARSDALKGVGAAERLAGAAPARAGAAEPVAIVKGEPVAWADLDRMMAEAAGGQVLEEVVLDRMLDRRAAQAGVTITAADIAAERRALVEAITRSAETSEDDAERLLANVRRSRGLGEVRFAHLLERNARLRKLIPPVSVSDDEVRQAFDIRHGPRFRTRVIVAASDRAAAEIRGELDQAPANLDDRSMFFATIAARKSTDPSAERGGMLEPISPADPAYPASLRAAVQRMEVGAISPVLGVDRGYAIALLEERIPADTVDFASEAEPIRAQVRVRRERLAMDALASDLLHEAEVRVTDPSLGWSWRAFLARTAGEAAGEE